MPRLVSAERSPHPEAKDPQRGPERDEEARDEERRAEEEERKKEDERRLRELREARDEIRELSKRVGSCSFRSNEPKALTTLTYNKYYYTFRFQLLNELQLFFH